MEDRLQELEKMATKLLELPRDYLRDSRDRTP